MTEIERYEDRAVEPAAAAPHPMALSDDAIRRLEKEMAFMGRLYQYAKQLCTSEFVPDVYKGKPENAAAAMQYGANFGLSGMAALQNIFLVKGRPSTYARVMYAAAIAAGHEMWEEPGASADGVTWHGLRSGGDKIFTATWTPERVKLAGYDGNSRYRTNPIEMLRAKCQAEVARYIAAEILAGMPYSREELELEEKPQRVRSQRVGRGVDALRQLPNRDAAPADESASEPSAGPAARAAESPQPQATDAGMSEQTRRKWVNRMFALLGEADCPERDDQLTVIGALSNGEPEHRDELTDDQLKAVVNQLNTWAKAGELGQQVTEILNTATITAAENNSSEEQ